LRWHGAATPGEVAAAERQQPQSLTWVFAELEADGPIGRAADSVDRRQSVLTLTADGLRALKRHMAERDAWLAEALRTLRETEHEVLRLAGALMDRLEEEPQELSSRKAALQTPSSRTPSSRTPSSRTPSA
jgi:DNA-binding MarR family transcriptional regulator